MGDGALLDPVDLDQLEEVSDPGDAGLERCVLDEPAHLVEEFLHEALGDPVGANLDVERVDSTGGVAQLASDRVKFDRDPLCG